MKELLLGLAAIVISILLCFGTWYFGMWPKLSSIDTINLDTYERVYSECMARETIGHDECHDLAVHAAYPND